LLLAWPWKCEPSTQHRRLLFQGREYSWLKISEHFWLDVSPEMR
jgi:hypothetical protein